LRGQEKIRISIGVQTPKRATSLKKETGHLAPEAREETNQELELIWFKAKGRLGPQESLVQKKGEKG